MNRRQIKFKFWCKGIPDSSQFDIPKWWNWPNLILEHFCTPKQLFSLDEFVPCQFTGLYDTIGNEIYENDIVKVIETNDGVRYEYICQVVYNTAGFAAKIVKPVDYKKFTSREYLSLEADDRHKVCVIGNIFEDSEWLT